MGMDPVSQTMMVKAGGEAINGLFQAGGDVMGAQAQGKALEEQAKLGLQGTREQIAEQGREFDVTSAFEKEKQAARQRAYDTAISTGGTQMDEAEDALLGSLNEANPEIRQMEADLASGNSKALQQGIGQAQANLAAMGARGGQAATLLNRATGEMTTEAQKEINGLKYQDAATRQALLRAYQAAKAQRGQAATLPSAGISI